MPGPMATLPSERMGDKSSRRNKPYPDFPLTLHPSGQWCKKVRRRIHYFGRDPDEALAKWLRQRDYLLSGRRPPHDYTGLTVRDLMNHFLTERQHRVDAGELKKRTFRDYYEVCEMIVVSLGRGRSIDSLQAQDFTDLRATFAKGRSATTVGNLVRMARMPFRYAYEAGLIDRPIRFGPSFRAPPKRIIRAQKLATGKRMFEALEIRILLAAADVPMRAMILLGINCGLGNADIGTLPRSAVDVDKGWTEFPRGKTAIERRCHLWPITSAAIALALNCRRPARDAAGEGLVFLTKYGKPWYRDARVNPLSAEFRKLLRSCGLYRAGNGFYSLRRTFETIAGDTGDQVAVDHVMGHSDRSMAAIYRQRIADERLRAVASHVWQWLFAGVRSGQSQEKPVNLWFQR